MNYTIEEHVRYSDLPPFVGKFLDDCHDTLQGYAEKIKRLEQREEELLERIGMARTLVEEIQQELHDMDTLKAARKAVARLIEESMLEW